MKKVFSFMMALIFVLALAQNDASSAPAKYTMLKASASATVAEVIDGDSVLVRLDYTGEYALVRMIGVNCAGYTPALEYATTKLMGNKVYVMVDGAIKSVERWNMAYIYLDADNFNKMLIEGGYAKVETAHQKAIFYKELVEAEKKPRTEKIGIWNFYGPNAPSYNYSLPNVNINTASKYDIADNLKISAKLAEDIVLYRAYTPFRTINEIKFVEGMTKEIFDTIRHRIVVSTNITTATKEEFSMLINVTEKEAEAIINYREKNGFKAVSNINARGLLSQDKYTTNRPYLSIEDTPVITVSRPEFVVNVNTASENQLKEAGFMAAHINEIITYRETLSFKNLKELQNALEMTDSIAADLFDNVSFITDVNTAPINELKSLFATHVDAKKNAEALFDARSLLSMYSIQRVVGNAMYERIKNYVYVSDATMPKYLNINTATKEQMKAIGFNDSQVSKLYASHMKMLKPNAVPLDLKALGFDMKVTLITNINKASAFELKSLSTYITDEIAEGIVAYSNDQPFGSLDEFKAYMLSIGRGFVYESVKDVICVR